MTSPASLAKTAPWPTGVVMRALTTGGHVDIVTNTVRGTATATCAGCGEEETGRGRGADSDARNADALNQAKAWTRRHAVCPFVPRPAATS